jgi:hypothetical protein
MLAPSRGGDGTVEYLLGLLREGTRDPLALADLLAARFPQVSETDVTAALDALDGLGLLVDAAAPVHADRHPA